MWHLAVKNKGIDEKGSLLDEEEDDEEKIYSDAIKPEQPVREKKVGSKNSVLHVFPLANYHIKFV
jgi:hypothetical protein